MKVLEKLNKFLETVTALFVAIITLLVLAQVLFRYVLKQPFTSSEEWAKYFVIWLVMLGFAILVRKNGHISVTYFAEKFSDKVQRILRIVVHILCAVFFLVLLIYGLDLSLKAMIQITPATGIRMGYVDLVIPIAGLLSLLFTIEHLYNEISLNKRTEYNEVEEYIDESR